jgi:hypothetical protein
MGVSIVTNAITNEYFFTKTHSVPEGMSEEWIPVSWHTKTREQVKVTEDCYGVEIPHPIPEMQG